MATPASSTCSTRIGQPAARPTACAAATSCSHSRAAVVSHEDGHALRSFRAASATRSQAPSVRRLNRCSPISSVISSPASSACNGASSTVMPSSSARNVRRSDEPRKRSGKARRDHSFGQVRIDGQGFAEPAHPGEALHHRLPDAAHGGHVQPAGGIAHVVGQVDGACQAELPHGLVGQSQRRGHGGVHGRRERAAVHGERLVVLVVGARHLERDLVGEHVTEHHHVGLLDHLGGVRHLPAQQQVGRHRLRLQHVRDPARRVRRSRRTARSSPVAGS